MTYRQLPMAAVGLGLVCYEWNDLGAAETQLWQGLASAQGVGREHYWSRAYTALARVAQARGDPDQACSLMTKALAIARDFGNPLMIAEAEVEQARSPKAIFAPWLMRARHCIRSFRPTAQDSPCGGKPADASLPRPVACSVVAGRRGGHRVTRTG